MICERWSKFWFVNGGGIHSAWKHKKYTLIKQYAIKLPELAWDTQQKELDRYKKALEVCREQRNSQLIMDSEDLELIQEYDQELDQILEGNT